MELGLKNNNKKEAIVSASRQYQFRKKLAKAEVDPDIINTYDKDPDLIQDLIKYKKSTKSYVSFSIKTNISFIYLFAYF
jgi:hypothetical protein